MDVLYERSSQQAVVVVRSKHQVGPYKGYGPSACSQNGSVTYPNFRDLTCILCYNAFAQSQGIFSVYTIYYCSSICILQLRVHSLGATLTKEFSFVQVEGNINDIPGMLLLRVFEFKDSTGCMVIVLSLFMFP